MLGFVWFGVFFSVTFGPCISHCLTSASSSCLESHCFPAGKTNRSSEMRQKLSLYPKSLACDFYWAISKEASRAPALSAAGSEIIQQSRSPCISTTALSQALPAPGEPSALPSELSCYCGSCGGTEWGERKMLDLEHPFSGGCLLMGIPAVN